MVKATIANYLIDNLANRFPMTQLGVMMDHEIIDVVVDGWDHNRYPVLGFNAVEGNKKSPHKRLLM